MRNNIRDYKVYGHDRGRKQKDRYLFTVGARNNDEALILARRRVMRAKVITRVILEDKTKQRTKGKRMFMREGDKNKRTGRVEAYTFGEAIRKPKWPY